MISSYLESKRERVAHLLTFCITFFNEILTKWLDFIFPPLCHICKEPSEGSLFCGACWDMCALPNPLGRCLHCFEEVEEELCPRCHNKASLPFPTAFVFEEMPPTLHLISLTLREDPESLAAFFFIQW